MIDREPAQLGESDYWQLLGDEFVQPKRQIGDYVEAAGFPVPRRYDSFDEALEAVARGQTIAVRSEHRQEYDGPSGLLETTTINKETIANGWGELSRLVKSDPEHALQQYMRQELSIEAVERYTALTGQTVYDFEPGLSYSFWEYIPGKNIAITADDAVPDRYHITAAGTHERGYCGWTTDAGGKAYREFDLRNFLTQAQRAGLIDMYEAIRNLPRFSSQECPIMEMQIDDAGRSWFLQYHKSRTYQPYNDTIIPDDYPGTEGWQEADFVRGALGPFVTLQAAVYYPYDYGTAGNSGYPLPLRESASFDLDDLDAHDPALREVLARRRTGYFAGHDFGSLCESLANGHEARSKWFKSQASLAIGAQAMGRIPGRHLADAAFGNGPPSRKGAVGRIVMDAASDGRRAFWRFAPGEDNGLQINWTDS